jgi:hypothetical protein
VCKVEIQFSKPAIKNRLIKYLTSPKFAHGSDTLIRMKWAAEAELRITINSFIKMVQSLEDCLLVYTDRHRLIFKDHFLEIQGDINIFNVTGEHNSRFFTSMRILVRPDSTNKFLKYPKE